MKTYYDIINETKNIEKVYNVVGADGSIQSVWPDKNAADEECKKVNGEIGGNYFTVKLEDAKEIL